ncbi:MAG: hypothetical protein E7358_02055 [Clostridiales bacterium]|nr:hypothetical protein [Clostridiales bacterium]
MINTAGEKEQGTVEIEVGATSQTAGAENSSGEMESAPYGKFTNAKDLLDAYNSLQSEFTRRCQKVKELERENNCLKQSEKPLEDSFSISSRQGKPSFKETYPETEGILKSLYDLAASSGDDAEGFLERAYVKYLKNQAEKQNEYYSSKDYIRSKINGDEDIKNEIIREYLDGINASKPKVGQFMGNGDGVISAPSKPKTLQDAAKIALQIFEKAKEIN